MSNTVYKSLYNGKLSWIHAINDAETLLREYKSIIRKLHAVIKHFRRMDAEGEPFPGEVEDMQMELFSGEAVVEQASQVESK